MTSNRNYIDFENQSSLDVLATLGSTIRKADLEKQRKVKIPPKRRFTHAEDLIIQDIYKNPTTKTGKAKKAAEKLNRSHHAIAARYRDLTKGRKKKAKISSPSSDINIIEESDTPFPNSISHVPNHRLFIGGQDPNEHNIIQITGKNIDVPYEKKITDPYRQLQRGRKYSVDDINMIYHNSMGNSINGESENTAYNFRTPVNVTPSSNEWITKEEFNNHNIIQINQDVKALKDAQHVLELHNEFNNTKIKDHKTTGWEPNGGLPTEEEQQRLRKAITVLQLAQEHMGLQNKGGIKNKSRKVKKSRRKTRKSLKKRRKTRKSLKKRRKTRSKK